MGVKVTWPDAYSGLDKVVEELEVADLEQHQVHQGLSREKTSRMAR
jgi:hypothetical protein